MGNGNTALEDVPTPDSKPGTLLIATRMENLDISVVLTHGDLLEWPGKDMRVSAIQERRQAALKCEILVPRFVPIERILEIKNG